ncbi:hypothetical protein GTP41_11565 [Pseudoduganella sp. DS3]|uniref:Uncharacterized protein n=1 Tax=Pseudoduganella guangdongensis TaxID=2692179 RepID=A0A6N9HH94_9BURK|nr:hypothetical protein [Pseudoduganella guangdongensis]MYN02736.1 hypothetical protein [Pseudoduganella guangdongensis]
MFKPLLCQFAGFTLLAAVAAMPVHADSFTSSASSAGSASSGSVSDSISGSSKSSSGDDKKVAAGQYRVMDVAQAPGKPGATRLTLRSDEGQQFFLDLPQAALAERALPAGALVQVSERPYGYEFAHADTRQAFFLALHDAWQRELRSHAI